MTDFALFGTEGCHLCEDAEALLAEAGIIFQKQDILDRIEWQEKYGWLIPVLCHIESQRQLNWPFDDQQVREFVNSCKTTAQSGGT